MHEMQTIVTDVCGLSLSVCLSVTRLNSVVHAVCAGSFDAASAKLLWPLVTVGVDVIQHGKTALHEALSSTGNIQIVMSLLIHGADPNIAPKVCRDT